MGTTPNGYPYPEDGDPVAQGAQAIKALALALDTALGAMAAGVVNIALNNVNQASKTVTFPVGRFKVAPVVEVTSTNANLYGVISIATTTTSFTAWLRVGTGTNQTITADAHWMARTPG